MKDTWRNDKVSNLENFSLWIEVRLYVPGGLTVQEWSKLCLNVACEALIGCALLPCGKKLSSAWPFDDGCSVDIERFCVRFGSARKCVNVLTCLGYGLDIICDSYGLSYKA